MFDKTLLNFYKIPSGTGVISSLRAKLRGLLKVTQLGLMGAGSHTQTSITESWTAHTAFPSSLPLRRTTAVRRGLGLSASQVWAKVV